MRSQHTTTFRLANYMTAMFCAVVAALFLAACMPISGRSRLPGSQGWSVLESRDPLKVHKAIRDDYEAYIKTLPRQERTQLTATSPLFLRNPNGQFAVKFTVYRDGFWSRIAWDHVLIYDSNCNRIKSMKYRSGRSMS